MQKRMFMLSVKKSTSSLSFRGDAYVKRDSSLYYASDSTYHSAFNDNCRYLELVILKGVYGLWIKKY